MLTPKAIYAYTATVAFLVLAAAAALPQQPETAGRTRRRLQQTNLDNCSAPIAISSSQIQLGSCPLGVFTLPLALGTPPQPQIYLLDTTSNYLWSAVQPNNPGGFAVGSSSSAEVGSSEAVVAWQNGSQIVGVEGSDLVAMGNFQDIRTPIYFVQQALGQTLGGVAGLGHSTQHKNFLDLAAAAAAIASSAYVLSLSPTAPAFFYYDQLPEEISAGSVRLPNHSHDYFSLEIIGFSVGGWPYETAIATRAVLDSSTPAFFLNSKIYNAVVSRFFQGCQGAQGCPCEQTQSWPTFAFMFPGAEAYIPPENYLQQLNNTNCTFNFGFVEDKEDTFILGTAFFYGYNITFDKKKDEIGLQGVLTPVQVANFAMFTTSQYVLLMAAVGLWAFSGWLAVQMRVERRLKTSRLSEISLTERFVESS